MPTTITGNLKNLNAANQPKAFVRFTLRGTGGNQPRILSTASLAPSGQGAEWHWDFVADASGNISGTLYSTRDAAGTGDGEIDCGGVKTAVWYGMAVWVNGKPGPEVPVHAKNGVTLDVSLVTPLSVLPVATAPTGDSTYLRMDGGNSPATGAIVFNNSLSAKRFENIRFADQFAGADAGAKIQAAHDDFGTQGGIIDARAFTGTQLAAATITLSKPGTKLLLGSCALFCAANPGINISTDAVTIEGVGFAPNIGTGNGGSEIVANNATSDLIKVSSGNGTIIINLRMIGGVLRTAGAGLNILGSGGFYKNLRMENLFNHIVLGTGGGGDFYSIVVATNGLTAGGWNTGILIGPVAAATVTTSSFTNCIINAGTGTWTDALVVLDSGTDGMNFTDCQFVQGTNRAICFNARNTSTSNDPEWNMVSGCTFEGGSDHVGVQIDACRGLTFNGCVIQGQQAVLINGGKDIRLTGNQIYRCNNEGVKVAGVCSGLSIVGNVLGDNGQAANNTYDDIYINAAATGFIVNSNTFFDMDGTAPANKPRYNINVASAGATGFNIVGNAMENSTAATGLINNSSGTGHWNVWSNTPISLQNDCRGPANINGTLSANGLVVFGANPSWQASGSTKLFDIAAPSGAINSVVCWSDSTAHRLKMNNNNGGAVTVAATSGDTFTTTTLTSPTINGTPTGTGIPTATLKTGTGAGNYTSASTSYVRVDSTNLAYTVTIPAGWKLIISASGNVAQATAANGVNIALADGSADNTGILIEIGTFPAVSGGGSQLQWALNYIVNGDGASHTINLQYKTANASDSVTIINASSTSKPAMTFLLTPSN